MKKIILILVYTSLQVFAQEDFKVRSHFNDYLYFLPHNNNLIALVSKYYYSKKNMELSFGQDFITEFSSENGNITKEILLSENDKGIFAFNTAKDGLSFVIISSESEMWYKNKGPFSIKKYLLNENRWAWEKQWYGNSTCHRITYSEDNKKIICVTDSETIIINSENGSLIKKSNSISTITDSINQFSRFELSKNGKYFANWERQFKTISYGDDLGFLTLIEFVWYGLKWLYHIGDIPNSVYIWDIEKDKLHNEIKIPYMAMRGIPTFSYDEKELVIGPFEGKYEIYSLENQEYKRDIISDESIYDNIDDARLDSAPDYKIVSPDNNYIAICIKANEVFIIDYNDGKLIKKFYQEDASPRTTPHIGGRYAMVFSDDSKYFAIVTKGNILNLYETKTWSKVWGKSINKLK